MKHVLLIGATDGIGLALARQYLTLRWRVCVMGRNPEKLERVSDGLRREFSDPELVSVECDVTEWSRAAPGFDEALCALGQIDLVVYCAGVMEAGSMADERAAAGRRMIEVNTTGAVPFLEMAADYLVEVGKGQLAAIGSVAGDRGRKGNPGYCASKAGLHTYLEGLRHRLHGTGVQVITIKPGFVKTRMLGDDAPPGAIEPEEAAEKIARGLERRRDEFYVPRWWRLVGLALRLMPRFLFKRIGPA